MKFCRKKPIRKTKKKNYSVNPTEIWVFACFSRSFQFKIIENVWKHQGIQQQHKVHPNQDQLQNQKKIVLWLLIGCPSIFFFAEIGLFCFKPEKVGFRHSETGEIKNVNQLEKK